MAKRRMLSIPIVETDKFYRLSAATQAFYMHLNLNADDDGIVDKVNLIMNQMRLQKKYYRELVDGGYIIELDEGLVVITHWHQHNKIRKERYVEGEYQDRLLSLSLQENGRYIKGKQDILGDKCVPQDRLGKDSIGKDSIVKVSTDKESIAEVREEKEEEKEEEKNKRNTLSFIHTESASQMDEQAVCNSSANSGLISNALRTAITLYFMKRYQTMESDEFINYCISRNWVGEDGESMMNNYKKYVDIWMSKK